MSFMFEWIVKANEFLDDLAHSLFIAKVQPKQPELPIVYPIEIHISPETLAWNNFCCNHRNDPANPAYSLPAPDAEEMKRRQEQSYRWNAFCLGLTETYERK